MSTGRLENLVSAVNKNIKNIILCSDGTGNSGGKTRGTNVWRIFNAIERHRKDVPQITYYDDGVGTENLRWVRLASGAFGWGISRNLQQLYSFLIMNYVEGDNVFLFGFSRGAFTVRSLAGMVCRCGLFDREWFLDLSFEKRDRALRRVRMAYRSAAVVPSVKDEENPDQKVQRVRKALNLNDLKFRNKHVPIHFLGVWDTVDAVGVPFDEIKVVDWLSRRLFKHRLWGFHDRTLSKHVHHAYQALALDDERRTFHPNIWSEPNTLDEPPAEPGAESRAGGCEMTRQQVWFVGAHSNVGGGYPKDSLSLVSLDWMMGKAAAHGLVFIDGRRREFQYTMDAHGRMYDSRTGFGIFYRYAARNIYEQPADPLPDDARFLDVLHYTFRKFVRYATRCFLEGLSDPGANGGGGLLEKMRRRLNAYVRPLEPVKMPKPLIHVSVRDRIARGTDHYAPKVISGDPSETEMAWTDGGPYAKSVNGVDNGSGTE